MSRRKRIEKFSGDILPTDAMFNEVKLVLQDVGFSMKPSGGGSHEVFVRERDQKTIPAISGRRVGRVYLSRVRENVRKWMSSSEKPEEQS